MISCAADFNAFDCKLPTAGHRTATVTAIAASKTVRMREKKISCGRIKMKNMMAMA